MSHRYMGSAAVLDWLRDRDQPATTKEVANALDMPMAVARERLQNLLAAEAVEHDSDLRWRAT